VEDAVCDIHPPRRRVDECLHGGDLADDQDRERVKVDLVNLVLDDEIADHAETNQRIHAGWGEDKRQFGKAAKGCVEQCAGRNQHQAPMELGLLAPVDSESKGYGEAGKVHDLDNRESRGVEWVLLFDGKPNYADGGPRADDNNSGSEPDTEPAELAMHADVVGADQRGLHNEEHNPSGEHNCVDVKDKGWERRGMYEVMVDGVAEAVDNSHSDQQRHEEIKVLTPETPTLGRHHIRQRVRFRAHFLQADNNMPSREVSARCSVIK